MYPLLLFDRLKILKNPGSNKKGRRNERRPDSRNPLFLYYHVEGSRQGHVAGGGSSYKDASKNSPIVFLKSRISSHWSSLISTLLNHRHGRKTFTNTLTRVQRRPFVFLKVWWFYCLRVSVYVSGAPPALYECIIPPWLRQFTRWVSLQTSCAESSLFLSLSLSLRADVLSRSRIMKSFEKKSLGTRRTTLSRHFDACV